MIVGQLKVRPSCPRASIATTHRHYELHVQTHTTHTQTRACAHMCGAGEEGSRKLPRAPDIAPLLCGSVPHQCHAHGAPARQLGSCMKGNVAKLVHRLVDRRLRIR